MTRLEAAVQRGHGTWRRSTSCWGAVRTAALLPANGADELLALLDRPRPRRRRA
ncbi:MAG: hypothetical protein U0531_04945 [Dehalococcoidia bacterium]